MIVTPSNQLSKDQQLAFDLGILLDKKIRRFFIECLRKVKTDDQKYHLALTCLGAGADCAAIFVASQKGYQIETSEQFDFAIELLTKMNKENKKRKQEDAA